MAVIAELIDAGIQMKRAGNLQGAIEHFRQLQATYPGNARIMFELANAWTAFAVPQRALPLYQELLALPPGEGLPPRDMPRLYTRLGATLLELGDSQQALTIIETGLSLHQSYRPLRFWRICAMSRGGADRLALLDALELLLESLAPSRWDVFEGDIQAAVKAMRAEWAGEATPSPLEVQPPAKASPASEGKIKSAGDARMVEQPSAEEDPQESAEASKGEVDIAVTVKPARQMPRQPRKPRQRPQMGRKAVRIDISAAGDAPKDEPGDEDEPPASPSAFKIPIEPD